MTARIDDLEPCVPSRRAQEVADELHARMARRFVIADVFAESSRSLRLEAGDGAAPASRHRHCGLQLRGVGRDARGVACVDDVTADGIARALGELGLSRRAAPAWPRSPLPLAADLDEARAQASLHRLLRALRRGAFGARVRVSLALRASARAVFRRRGDGARWQERSWVLCAEVGLGDVVSVGRCGRDPAPSDAVVDALAEATLRERRAALRGGSRVAGRMPVVLAAGASGAALHELVGHSLEADHVLSGDSTLAPGDVVARDALTVVDDPAPLDGAGGLRIDDEGTVARAVTLVDAGRVVGMLHDRVTAALCDTRGMGNGRRADHRHEPSPRMRNLSVAAGPDDPSALLSDIRDGLYIERLSGWNVGGRFCLDAHAARRIRRGALAEPVRGAVILGAVRDALAAVEGVGRDALASPEPLLCVKGGEVLSGIAGPTLRFAALEVS